jgi:hypothetical protein
MANTIKIKRKTTTGAPSLGSLSDGEFCYVVPDDVLYLRKSATVLQSFLPSQVLTQSAYDALSQPEKDASGLVIIVG